MKQVAMSGVDLNEIEPGVAGAPRRGSKIGDHFTNARSVEFLRNSIVRCKLNRTGGDNVRPSAVIGSDKPLVFPGPPHTGFPPGMRQLHTDMGPLRVDEPNDLRELGNM